MDNQSNAENKNEKGMRYENAGNYAKAFQLYEEAAKENEPFAIYNLGRCYYYGNGAKQNYDTAVQYFLRSAELGFAPAQYSIADCYADGIGVEKDIVKAVEWCEKAANQNYPTAQCTLGVCYYYGNGVLQDYVEAVEWFEKAANNGDAQAMLYLGECYELGEGVQQDFDKSLNYKANAANAGFAEAQYQLGLLYTDAADKGDNNLYRDAINWFQKAADQGHILAQLELGNLVYDGKGVNPNYEYAAKLYESAAEQDIEQAQLMLGYMYYCGIGVAEDHSKSLNYFYKAATNGNPIAQCEVGKAYEYGKGVDQDLSIAIEWYTKSATQGYADAQYCMGLYFYNRAESSDYERVENYKAAIDWFQKASHQNDAESKYYLGKCYSEGKGVLKNIDVAIKLYKAAAEQGVTQAEIELLCFQEDLELKNRISDAEYEKMVNGLAKKGALSAYCDKMKNTIAMEVQKIKETSTPKLIELLNNNTIKEPTPWNYSFILVLVLNILMPFCDKGLWLILTIPLTIAYFTFIVFKYKNVFHLDDIKDKVFTPCAFKYLEDKLTGYKKKVINFKIINSISLIAILMSILLPIHFLVCIGIIIFLVIFNFSKHELFESPEIYLMPKMCEVEDNRIKFSNFMADTNCPICTMDFHEKTIHLLQPSNSIQIPYYKSLNESDKQAIDKEFGFWESLFIKEQRLFTFEQYESEVKSGGYVSFTKPKRSYIPIQISHKKGYSRISPKVARAGFYGGITYQQNNYQQNYYQQSNTEEFNFGKEIFNEFKGIVKDEIKDYAKGKVKEVYNNFTQSKEDDYHNQSSGNNHSYDDYSSDSSSFDDDF